MSEAVKSPTDTLMNLRSGDAASSATASLMLLAKSGNQLNIVSSASLHGLLAPDLLCYSVSSGIFIHTAFLVLNIAFISYVHFNTAA